MGSIRPIAIAGALATTLLIAVPVFAAPEDGVALAIVYDTSGSMKEQVRDATGTLSPKYVIANRALEAITMRIQKFATNSPAGGSRRIDAGLFVFDGKGAKRAVEFGPFNPAAFRNWARKFSTPEGGTPLGNALATASETVLHSNLARKHVLVITDGVNTMGPDPATVMPRLKQLAEREQTSLAVHFVAFDAAARIFDGVKKMGATVVSASDEAQLKSQLQFILEKQILLEDEEPPKKN